MNILDTLQLRISEIIEAQHNKINQINISHMGTADLFTEYRLLKDAELLRDELARIMNLGNAIDKGFHIAVIIPCIFARNPHLKELLGI